ncbi:MAG: hypothetical protein ACOZCO_03145 [Bacteroidota bacterium]
MKSLLYVFVSVLISLSCSSDISKNKSNSKSQSGPGPEKQKLPEKFEIEILEWGGMVNGDDHWLITPDSIIFTSAYVDPELDSAVTVIKRFALTKEQAKKISSALAELKPDTFPKDNVGHSAPDDLREFDFTVTTDGVKNEFHIYCQRITLVENLVTAINEILPETDRIAYNESYFGRCGR